MADYTATAICEGDYWVIDVPGVGTTQADSVDDIEDMAVDLVIAMTPRRPTRCARPGAHRLTRPPTGEISAAVLVDTGPSPGSRG
jgi:hypothetical protein